MPFKATNKPQMSGEDLIFQAMDLATTNLFYNDVDLPSSAIAINTSGTQSWDFEIFPELHRFEKLLSSSPNTFVNSEYGANINTPTGSNPGSQPHAVACPTAKAIADNVRLRNHDCMWSGRCNQQESHQKMKLKAAAAAQNQRASNKLPTPAQSPTKQRTIQAGESLLRFKQPSKCASGDENNNNRPDTPQSLGGGDDQEINCTTTGSNQLPLLMSKDAAKEHEVNKIKEYLSDPAKQQYKAYDNSTTLADVINTLESGEFSSSGRRGGDANGVTTGGVDGCGGGNRMISGYPLSPADESDCGSHGSSRSVQAVDDDTESEHEMDDEYSLQDDDEGISLKMMPTSHLSSSRLAGFETSSLSRMSMGSNSTMRMHSGQGSSDEEEDEDEEDDEEEEDEKPDVNMLMQQTGQYHHHQQVEEEEEDSGTERSLYGNTLTLQEKNLLKQQTSMHSDHCYTRVKSRLDIQSLGVETPSDSGELKQVLGVVVCLSNDVIIVGKLSRG